MARHLDIYQTIGDIKQFIDERRYDYDDDLIFFRHGAVSASMKRSCDLNSILSSVEIRSVFLLTSKMFEHEIDWNVLQNGKLMVNFMNTPVIMVGISKVTDHHVTRGRFWYSTTMSLKNKGESSFVHQTPDFIKWAEAFTRRVKKRSVRVDNHVGFNTYFAPEAAQIIESKVGHFENDGTYTFAATEQLTCSLKKAPEIGGEF